MFWLLAPFVANLYIAWLPLPPPWSSFLSATEKLAPGGLGVLNIPTKENNSLFTGCDYSLVDRFLPNSFTPLNYLFVSPAQRSQHRVGVQQMPKGWERLRPSLDTWRGEFGVPSVLRALTFLFGMGRQDVATTIPFSPDLGPAPPPSHWVSLLESPPIRNWWGLAGIWLSHKATHQRPKAGHSGWWVQLQGQVSEAGGGLGKGGYVETWSFFQGPPGLRGPPGPSRLLWEVGQPHSPSQQKCKGPPKPWWWVCLPRGPSPESLPHFLGNLGRWSLLMGH